MGGQPFIPKAAHPFQRGLGGAEEMCSRSVHRHRWGTQNWSQIHELACIYLNCWFSEPNPQFSIEGDTIVLSLSWLSKGWGESVFSYFFGSEGNRQFCWLVDVSCLHYKEDWMIWLCILFHEKGCVVCIAETTIWFDQVYSLSKKKMKKKEDLIADQVSGIQVV